MFSFSSPAKINLFLHVGGVQKNGLHQICSLNVFTSLYDTIHYFPDNPSGISGLEGITREDCYISRLLHQIESLHDPPIKIGHFHIKKRIPIRAGLGGGTSNAASVFRAIKSIHKLEKSESLLSSLSDKIGSDFYSCLQSDPHIVSGTGETISPIPKTSSNHLLKMGIIVVTPKQRLSTPVVFNKKDRISQPLTNIESPLIPSSKQELLFWLGNCRNDLTPAAVIIAPIIGKIIKQLELLPECLLARMSGSGSSCFAIFNNINCAKKALPYLLENKYLKNSTLTYVGKIVSNELILKKL